MFSKIVKIICSIYILSAANLFASTSLESTYYDQLQDWHLSSQAASIPSLDFVNLKALCLQGEDLDCFELRKALIEYLYQYGEDLAYDVRLRLMDYLEENKVFDPEMELDKILLGRALLGINKNSLETSLSDKNLYKLCAYRELLTAVELQSLDCSWLEEFKPGSNIGELVGFTAEGTNRSSLYMFCRMDRHYPCYMILKNTNGEWVRQNGKEIWGQPSLGYSRKGKAAIKKNGHTPMGVYYINAVMPSADQSYVFGDFRRMILDFIPEAKVKKYLPKEHLNQNWWQEAITADRVGRKYLRIHGTGRKNGNEKSLYYPFMATVGCVSQREGNYRDLKEKFVDQRNLLDKMMEAQFLNPIYENETKVSSLLYVVNLDSQKKPVTREEILSFLSIQ